MVILNFSQFNQSILYKLYKKIIQYHYILNNNTNNEYLKMFSLFIQYNYITFILYGYTYNIIIIIIIINIINTCINDN